MQPMPSDEEIKKFVKTSDARRHTDVQIFGPSVLGDTTVWEVWLYLVRDEEWATGFVRTEGGVLRYHDSFGSLVQTMHAKIGSMQDELSALSATHHLNTKEMNLRFVKLGVATVAFLSTLGTFLYLLAAKDCNPGSQIASVLLGVVISGSAYFFGKWIRPDVKESQ